MNRRELRHKAIIDRKVSMTNMLEKLHSDQLKKLGELIAEYKLSEGDTLSEEQKSVWESEFKKVKQLKAELDFEYKRPSLCEELISGIKAGDLSRVKKTFNDGADINGFLDNSLYEASIVKRTDILEFLVNNGADVNAIVIEEYERGLSFLHVLIDNFKDKDLLDMLNLVLPKIEHINNQDGLGSRTALHEAAKLKHTDIHIKVLEVLIKNGAYVNAVSNEGATPLTYASLYNNLDAARLLINNGAYLNVINIKGNTILEVAASRGHLEMMKLLAENGAVLSKEYDPVTTPKELKLKPEAIKFFEEKYPALRNDGEDKQKKGFNNELKDLFNEEWLTKGPLLDYYYQKPPIKYDELIYPTIFAADTSRQELINSGRLSENKPALDSARAASAASASAAPASEPKVSSSSSNSPSQSASASEALPSVTAASASSDPALYREVEFDKISRKMSIEGMSKYIGNALDPSLPMGDEPSLFD